MLKQAREQKLETYLNNRIPSLALPPWFLEATSSCLVGNAMILVIYKFKHDCV